MSRWDAARDKRTHRRREPTMVGELVLAACRCEDVAGWLIAQHNVGWPCWTCGAPLVEILVRAA